MLLLELNEAVDFALHKGVNKCRVFMKTPSVLLEPSCAGDFLNIMEQLEFGSRPEAEAVDLLLLRPGCSSFSIDDFL